MKEVFGPITGGTLVFLVTLLTNYLKDQFKELTPRQIQLVAAGLAFLGFIPFHILSTLMLGNQLAAVDIAWMVFESIIYSIFGWLAAIGIYEVGFKRH